MPAHRVSVINLSNTVRDTEVRALADALQQQVSRDFEPAWGRDAEISFTTRDQQPPSGAWWLTILDHSDQASVAGLHDLTSEGLPLAKVFAETALASKRSWTVAASHELLEMLADPGLNLAASVQEDGVSTVFYAYEICDPCEGDEFGYLIDDIKVADFVYPAWFEPFRKPSESRFDQQCHISWWLQLLPGGYATVLDPRTGLGWFQVYSDNTPRSSYASPRAGSRRLRRRATRGQWRRSSLQAAASPARAASSGSHSGPFMLSNPSSGKKSIALVTPGAGVIAAVDEVDRAISAISHSEQRLTNREELLQTLRQARAKLSDPGLLNGEIPEDKYSALLLSVLANPAARQGGFKGYELTGFDEYGTLDINWITHYLSGLNQQRVAFPHHDPQHIDDTITTIADKVRIAIAGDWGTGLPSSKKIADQIAGSRADHTIHLGDVYYAGSSSDELQNFLNPSGNRWPPGTSGSAPSFSLNSNHEMYSGGQGYFGVLLQDPRFRAQKFRSYFALENTNWLIVGLDTAYYSPDPLFQFGQLNDAVQLPWLTSLAQRARDAAKKIILLTHHDGVDIDRRTNEVHWKPLWDQIVDAMNGAGPDYWYWGHIHAGIAYKAKVTPNGSVLARCVGHGGIPFEPYKTSVGLGDGTIEVAWVENRLAHDDSEGRRALNGFVILELDGLNISEEFRDENGDLQWSGS